MAVNFRLYPKDGVEPAVLPKVDDALCQHLGITPHPKKYYHGWYDYVGFMLACGGTWIQILMQIDEWREKDQAGADKMEEVVLWLQSHYIPESFWSR